MAGLGGRAGEGAAMADVRVWMVGSVRARGVHGASCISIYLSIYIYIYTHTYIYIYIYIYMVGR